VYRVQVAGEVTLETVKKLRDGVYFSDGFAKAADCVIKGQHKQSTILDLTLTEGMNREVRRLLAKLGHKVQTLFRIAVGPIRLGKLTPGEWRFLSKEEINAVRKSILSFPVKKCDNRNDSRNGNRKRTTAPARNNSTSPKGRDKKTTQRLHRTK
jgi:23S rRNA pseudouridine2605 synthase